MHGLLNEAAIITSGIDVAGPRVEPLPKTA